jgi:hypothetical protein
MYSDFVADLLKMIAHHIAAISGAMQQNITND